MHKNSELLFVKYGLVHFKTGQKVFEIGPNPDFTYKRIIKENVKDIIYYYGDMANYHISDPNCIKFNSEYEIDVPDESFDIVFNGQVIEHVRKPWRWIKEIARIVKTNGKVIIINPVNWKFHEYPVDCWRIYPEGIKALFEDAKIQCEFSTFENLDRRAIDTFSVGIKLNEKTNKSKENY
jgi:SAM-dependent methyltransferase